MDLAFSHASNQRVLRQRNFLVVVAGALAAITALLLAFGISRDREIVLQPVLRSPVTVSSAGVSREYLEMITRDVVVLTLDRSPQNLEYWMNAVLEITSPRVQGKIKSDLLKIVNEQRGSPTWRIWHSVWSCRRRSSRRWGNYRRRWGPA